MPADVYCAPLCWRGCRLNLPFLTQRNLALKNFSEVTCAGAGVFLQNYKRTACDSRVGQIEHRRSRTPITLGSKQLRNSIT